MSSGCVYTHPFSWHINIDWCYCVCTRGTTIIISAWAIGVARSTKLGNAKASKCGMGSRRVPTLSFCAVANLF